MKTGALPLKKKEESTVVLDTRKTLEAYRLLIEEGHEVVIRLSGNSMLPFMRGGRDEIRAGKTESDPRVGDVVLYTRADGSYVCHRIVSRGMDGTYTLMGDAQTIPEPGVNRDRIFALVTGVIRDGKMLDPQSMRWKFYSGIYTRHFTVRRAVLSVFMTVHRLKRHFTRKNTRDH